MSPLHAVTQYKQVWFEFLSHEAFHRWRIEATS